MDPISKYLVKQLMQLRGTIILCAYQFACVCVRSFSVYYWNLLLEFICDCQKSELL